MLKVLHTFFDGNSHALYIAGIEIADDSRLTFAEKRGLVKRIEEEMPQTEEKSQPKKTAVKKATKK